jgi:hypothetical protein
MRYVILSTKEQRVPVEINDYLRIFSKIQMKLIMIVMDNARSVVHV